MTNDSWATRFSAWGALFVTVVVFTLLGMGLVFSYWASSEPSSSFTNLMETIKALAMLSAGYWVGSSNSSQKKDDTITKSTEALAASVPVILPAGTKTVITTPETITTRTEPKTE